MYCKFCGTTNKLQVHHIDGNHDNNAMTNRVKLCQRCHSLVHKYLGVADPDEIEAIAKRAKEMKPANHSPTLFDDIE
jgi:5-methylcytosine-specific restriction endonuclease McrA